MTRTDNPALKAFVAELPLHLEFAQVLISRRGEAFELRHVADAAATDSALELLVVESLRNLANHTQTGAFRPLKSAPNLRNGWRVLAHSAEELETALAHLYPGALADWHAARQTPVPVTHYRDYVNRQTGMYRISQMLSDTQVRDVASAACHRDFCLKQRLWGGPELPTDDRAEKSLIPCLELCPMLLEFARKSMRLEQEEKALAKISEGDLQTLLAAVDMSLVQPPPDGRAADFAAPENPRRLRRLKIALERWLAEVPKKEEKG
ncbi:MAG: DR2241 family protein [Verrucomicrobiota bacterium]